jgi:DNA-binding PadR family transcriptional regulator
MGHGRDRMGGRGRERMFEQGDLKFVVLNLLSERPRHGYEIIKAIEELAGGEYCPSPGVIYPTLTLLEELGQATVTLEQGGKKQYGITAEGTALLASQQEILERILGRLQSAGAVADARRAPELQRSMQNFKTALHFRLSRDLDPAALRKIADAIDRAAVDIERS